MSELKTNKISPAVGTGVALGDSGDTFTIPSGATIVNSGTATGFGGGKVLQVVHVTTGAVASSTTVMPYDDTIPQNGEGFEAMSLAITPTMATSALHIHVVANTAGPGGFRSYALFKDAVAGAIASTIEYNGTSQDNTGVIEHRILTGSTSTITFKVRVGTHVAGTTVFNGNGAAVRMHGGVLSSSITITEIAV